mgnify:CR=1 FL=1
MCVVFVESLSLICRVQLQMRISAILHSTLSLMLHGQSELLVAVRRQLG